MDNELIIADFLTHQDCIRKLLRNLTAINEDHLELTAKKLQEEWYEEVEKAAPWQLICWQNSAMHLE